MKQYDITLLTAEQYLNPIDPDWYVKQILQEDQLVREALERKGLHVHRIDWSSSKFDWTSTKAVLFRSTWDYTSRYEEFLQFIQRVSSKTRLINPAETILWNLDKHYLRDLEQRGTRIPQTIYIEKKDTITLQALYAQHNFSESILKPVMSAGARHTYRLNKENFAHHENIFQELIANEAMMLQPFLHTVMTHGEITLVIIGGKYSHAVLKRAKSGDFRVQDDFGGSVHHYQPTQEEILFAERTVSVCNPLPVYARVDLLRDNNGQLVVSELELIEPELWFRFHHPAADSLANEILKYFQNYIDI